MIGTDWHIEPDDLAEYTAGRAGPARLASVEAHLGRCAACRAALTDQVTGAGDTATDPDRVWARIAERVDGNSRPFGRWPSIVTVSLASPLLALATLTIAAALIGFVGLARLGSPRYATTMLVCLGPIAPLVGAHIAFGRLVDPAGRMAAAVPVAAGRVAGARALMATVLACIAGLALTPLTTMTLGTAVSWLAPALAGSALAVAIATFVDPTLPTAVLGAGWLAACGAWLAGAPRALRGMSTDGLVTHRADVQVALLVVAAAAAVLTVLRGDAAPGWRSE